MTEGPRTEVLAPAGDRAAMEAAVLAGADAVYFGLSSFSARARATNFQQDELTGALGHLHRHGVKGYVALNTLLFDSELDAAAQAIRACARAGVDALIVQDLGVAALARALAPELALHASTQMTCTDAASVELARSVGVTRVVLARELSLEEIASIRRASDMELEVFVHGALCIAYSGQCLTSEAIGGRSANRGACAQACRLPYDLVVDGRHRDLGDRAYLLSPEDLEASHQVPELVALGVRSLKIEGRLKSPDYVAATTRLYRAAVDAAMKAAATSASGRRPRPDPRLREQALQMYSRGSGPGFLAGVNHQRLVDGRTCEHRGLRVGTVTGTRRIGADVHLQVRLEHALALGDGVVVAGGREGAGELGGRIWGLHDKGQKRQQVPAGGEAALWLGPQVAIDVRRSDLAGRALHRTSDPAASREVRAALKQQSTVALDLRLGGQEGSPARLEGRSARGHSAAVDTDVPLLRPQGGAPLSETSVRAQLERLGGTPFHLGRLTLDVPPGLGLPPSALNRARRALVEALAAPRAPSPLLPVEPAQLLAAARAPGRSPPPPGLFVLCRSLDQARAALTAGADGIYLDILELTGTGDAFRTLRAEGAPWVGLAPPRIRKPGEEKIDRFLRALGPAALLVRGLGALHELAETGAPDDASRPLAVGDFSLNVTNRLAAAAVLARGLDVFTPAFDLDAAQLRALVAGDLAAFAEVVVHHPMPLFHMEHCVFAALLSSGKDFRDCGRPCERHQLALRDRAGMEHPVQADVGCRNTVFHAAAQSAADVLPALRDAGVGRFRIELVRESPAEVTWLVNGYRSLLGRQSTPAAWWNELRARGCGAGYGVVRGSLRVLA